MSGSANEGRTAVHDETSQCWKQASLSHAEWPDCSRRVVRYCQLLSESGKEVARSHELLLSISQVLVFQGDSP